MVLPSVTYCQVGLVKEAGSRVARSVAESRGVERRAGLLEAADRVVQREGSAASMNLIAAEAGITKPILYRHFGDKSGLYRALAARTRATVDAYLTAIEESPQIYRFLIQRAAVEEPDVRGEVEGFVRRFGDELAAGIRNEPTLQGIPATRATVWAHGIAGMVQGAGDWWLDHPEVPRAVVADELSALLLAGFDLD
jgi:AcrR family transcriptional regulator